MREIKFRAWEPEIKEMHHDELAGIIKAGSTRTISKKEQVFMGRAGYFTGTLMQFTGLLDKNGKDIYEGDILKQHRAIARVVWPCKELPGFGLRWYGAGLTDDDVQFLWCNEAENLEVIGNIYENPELMEV